MRQRLRGTNNARSPNFSPHPVPAPGCWRAAGMVRLWSGQVNTYMICDGNGDQLCDGLSEDNARAVAQSWADRLDKSVYILLSNDDESSEGEEVEPS